MFVKRCSLIFSKFRKHNKKKKIKTIHDNHSFLFLSSISFLSVFHEQIAKTYI